MLKECTEKHLNPRDPLSGLEYTLQSRDFNAHFGAIINPKVRHTPVKRWFVRCIVAIALYRYPSCTKVHDTINIYVVFFKGSLHCLPPWNMFSLVQIEHFELKNRTRSPYEATERTTSS